MMELREPLGVSSTPWSELFKTTFGPLVGAAIALAAIWIKEFFDRRRSVQEWYEKSYVEEGVDRLTSFIVNIEYRLTDLLGFKSDKAPLATEEMPTLPMDSIIRLQIILQTDVFTNLFPALYASAKTLASEDGDHEEINAIIELAHALHDGLGQLRKELLKVKIKRKAAIYDIASKPEISSALVNIETKVEETRKSIVEVENKLTETRGSLSRSRRTDRSKSRRHS